MYYGNTGYKLDIAPLQSDRFAEGSLSNPVDSRDPEVVGLVTREVVHN